MPAAWGRPLAEDEARVFAICEAAVAAGLRTFIEMGAALRTIRDGVLYRQFGTFAQYCEERWGMKARQAQRLMVAAEIAQNLADRIGSLKLVMPEGERFCRPLAALPKDRQWVAWAQAVNTAPDGKLTVKHVDEVVKRIKGEDGGWRMEDGSDTLKGGHRAKPDNLKVELHTRMVDAREVAASREDRVRVELDETIAKAWKLKELIGTADTAIGSELHRMVQKLSDYKLHLTLVEQTKVHEYASPRQLASDAQRGTATIKP